jgi:hypothetical protein
MNIEQLFGGFQILIIGTLLSSLVFCLEVLSKKKKFVFLRKFFEYET